MTHSTAGGRSGCGPARPLNGTRSPNRFSIPPLKVVDPRFVAHRTHFEVRVGARLSRMSWWQECVFGLVEPLEFVLEEKPGGKVAGRVLVWEMEGFGYRWNNLPSVGVCGLH